MAMPGGRLAVELEILRIGLRTELDPPDILDPDQAAALGGLVLDDNVRELAGIVEPRLDVDRILEVLVCSAPAACRSARPRPPGSAA